MVYIHIIYKYGRGLETHVLDEKIKLIFLLKQR